MSFWMDDEFTKALRLPSIMDSAAHHTTTADHLARDSIGSIIQQVEDDMRNLIRETMNQADLDFRNLGRTSIAVRKNPLEAENRRLRARVQELEAEKTTYDDPDNYR